ncbi:MAG TPA: FAD-dependent oxidoreductase [Longimicrobium sp.]|nr:FAD-dependent oxidoreductase [Longimicrobium sp.]
MDAVVVGAGVVGLSTAIRLQEAGWKVRVWTAHHPLRTVSAVAAAIWYPYRARPPKRVYGWACRTYDAFRELEKEDPRNGVRMVAGVEYWRNAKPKMWHDKQLREAAQCQELPCDREGFAGRHRFTAPVAEMPVYLSWLMRRVADAGGVIESRRITALADVRLKGKTRPLVVNCTGLGALQVMLDRDMYPIRGQVVIVENPGLTEWVAAVDEETATYVIPRSRDCVLGGTSQKYDWNLEPDADSARSILERCIALVPEVAGARVLEQRVGLRPARKKVCLEADETQRVIHNYGHGGAGMTLSWGCADEVAKIAEKLR